MLFASKKALKILNTNEKIGTDSEKFNVFNDEHTNFIGKVFEVLGKRKKDPWEGKLTELMEGYHDEKYAMYKFLGIEKYKGKGTEEMKKVIANSSIKLDVKTFEKKFKETYKEFKKEVELLSVNYKLVDTTNQFKSDDNAVQERITTMFGTLEKIDDVQKNCKGSGCEILFMFYTDFNGDISKLRDC